MQKKLAHYFFFAHRKGYTLEMEEQNNNKTRNRSGVLATLSGVESRNNRRKSNGWYKTLVGKICSWKEERRKYETRMIIIL